MTVMADTADIESVTERVVADRLGEGAKIISVSVTDDRDTEGDDILIIRIVYESKTGRLDSKRVAGLIRHLRSKLHDEIDEDRFPLLSFVSRREAEAEAA